MPEPVDWLPSILSEPLFWVHQHQTLIAGIFASVAAYLTIKALNSQMLQSDIQFATQLKLAEDNRIDELERRHRMLRAGLPVALAELSTYAENCVIITWNAKFGGQNVVQSPFPGTALKTIQAVVETADEPVVRDLEKLLRFFQIQNSRFRHRGPGNPVVEADPLESNLNSAILDALLLRAGVSRLYTYARGESSRAEEWSDTERALNAIPTIVLPPGGGALPAHDDVRGHLERFWTEAIRRYG